MFHHALNSICCSLGFALLVCSFSSLHCIFTIICVVHLLSRALLSSSGLLFCWIAALLRLQLACFTLLLCVSLYGLEGLLLAFSCFFFMCLWCIFSFFSIGFRKLSMFCSCFLVLFIFPYTFEPSSNGVCPMFSSLCALNSHLYFYGWFMLQYVYVLFIADPFDSSNLLVQDGTCFKFNALLGIFG